MPRSRRLGWLLWTATLCRNCTHSPSLCFKFLTHFLLIARLLPFLWHHLRTVFIENSLFIHNSITTLSSSFWRMLQYAFYLFFSLPLFPIFLLQLPTTTWTTYRNWVSSTCTVCHSTTLFVKSLFPDAKPSNSFQSIMGLGNLPAGINPRDCMGKRRNYCKFQTGCPNTQYWNSNWPITFDKNGRLPNVIRQPNWDLL